MFSFRAIIVALAATLISCIATPVPYPPTADADLITMEAGDSEVIIDGADGAVTPGPGSLRITWLPGPTSRGFPWSADTTTSSDGAFQARMAGSVTDYYYLEVITDDDDVFVLAFTGGSGTSILPLEPADRDGDGSPDLIDCAPDDEAVGGQRCDG